MPVSGERFQLVGFFFKINSSFSSWLWQVFESIVFQSLANNMNNQHKKKSCLINLKAAYPDPILTSDIQREWVVQKFKASKKVNGRVQKENADSNLKEKFFKVTQHDDHNIICFYWFPKTIPTYNITITTVQCRNSISSIR